MWIREAGEPVASGAREQNEDEGRRLRRWVEALAVPRNFWAEASANRRTGERIAAELARLGYDVELQGTYRNVVALPAGRGDAPVTLVAAHYDTVPGSPGADDNASGVAVLLESARVLAGRDDARRVGFVAFNAEEDGLLGSRSFVTEGLVRLRLRVRAAHVLEMCGFRSAAPGSQASPLPFRLPRLERGTFIAVVGQSASNRITRGIVEGSSPVHRVGLTTVRGTHRILPDLARSDHAPFWEANLPAVLWTDTGNFRNPHYHAATDTPDTLDYAFMAGVRELVCRACEDREAPPDQPARA